MDPQEKRRILKELDDLPEELYDELLADLAASVGTQLGQLRDALSDGRAKEMLSLAHAIKGAAANMRVYAVQEAASALEESLRGRGSGRPVESLVAALDDAVDALVREVGVS